MLPYLASLIRHSKFPYRPWRFILLPLLQTLFLCGSGFAQTTFTNPLLDNGADPWVFLKDGTYYYTQTLGNRLAIWKTKDLTQLAQATPVTVWKPPQSGPNSEAIWAPELHFLYGKWYLYYTATDAANPGDATRYVFVLENASADPQTGTWVDRGRVNTTYAGLDGSVFTWKGQLYFLYSAYVGPQSRLYLARMENPWTLTGPQVELAQPLYEWEKFGEREILEGPEFLVGRNGKVCIVYSASACWDDNYALGLLTASGDSDLMDPAAWTRSVRPVFGTSAKNNVYGPGHNCFTTSPDGTEDWIVYHAKATANGECRERNVRMQPFGWHADGTPHFDEPVDTDHPLPKPSNR
ncbi:Beta-xylosidase, GH43 family [Catalinimonas alkaloidigena]|uniref:Beta-xylosidase, GH43 family n=1 Tax=Catalinimonas alkaloidigena TaxID=1075417 RepID=A0A1G9A0P8_9BACT|nr:glycoside hydrolase family 43 protein [Catalinimonas alkaloidigena]SDK20831.1 Beta-xylosidase, GH43 family [Catalinimonas alkaloidigena]